MEFMEKLQKQKDDAKAAYIKARDEWADRSPVITDALDTAAV